MHFNFLMLFRGVCCHNLPDCNPLIIPSANCELHSGINLDLQSGKDEQVL